MMVNKQFIPITIGAILSLLATFSPLPFDVHIVVRILISIAALLPLFTSWSALKISDKIILSLTIIIYNPLYIIQLGSGFAWGSVGLFLVIYFGVRVISGRIT
jgi:hypothetical protein